MMKNQLKQVIMLISILTTCDTLFARDIGKGEADNNCSSEGVEGSICDLNDRIARDPVLMKGLQQLFDTRIKDEATRKRECARLATMTSGKLGISLDTIKNNVDSVVNGQREFPGESRLSGKCDVWKKYRGLVGKLESSLIHKGSLQSLNKNELDQVVSNHDQEWTKVYLSLRDSSKLTSKHKMALERANRKHKEVMIILNGQRRDHTTIKKILPYLGMIKQDLTSLPNFTLAKENAGIHSKLKQFQGFYDHQSLPNESQINAMLAEKRKKAMANARKYLNSPAAQKQLNQQYANIATIKDKLENPMASMLRDQLDCE
jgi:hypothetical protein